MEATYLNLDGSAYVPVTLRQAKSFGFIVVFEVPVTGTWDIVFSRDEAGNDPVMTLLNGNGFSIAGDTITVFVSKAANKLKQGTAITMRISQKSGDADILCFTGPVKVLP